MRRAGSRPVAVVTGASRGLGAVLAGYLRGEGYDLVVVARHRRELDAAVQSLPRGPGTVVSVVGDVARPATRNRARQVVNQRGGRLRLLVNNASELGPSPLPRLDRFPLDRLAAIYRVNVVAPIAWVQDLAPALERGKGWIVNITSDAAVGGYPGWGGYGASKAALDLVTRTMAQELADRGIVAVSVDPGDLRTVMHQAAFPGEDISDRPLPGVTVPFWAWLLHQPPSVVTGHRFRAQVDPWEVPA